MTRNPYAGEPFSEDAEAITAALADVSVPALMCSLVHLTGDPSWIRGEIGPRMANAPDIQSGMPAEEQAEIRRRAVPAILAYRDAGCVPHEPTPELLGEMFAFMGRRPVEGSLAGLFLDDLQFDGRDHGEITWGDEIPAEVKATSDVLVIGGGMAGILAGIRLRQAGLPFTIIEKNAGPGGTWWENRYPGARVDIASHQYCYSFEPSHLWSEYYCQQPELAAYFRAVVDKYELWPHFRFDTSVDQLTWDEADARWEVRISGEDGAAETLRARFVISAVGSLNIPRLPDIPGMDTFAGRSFHSTRWPADLDLTGTRFALVGAGASGFQIGPAIADTVDQLTIFQRTAQWVIPNMLYHRTVPAGDRWALRHLPFYGRWFRFIVSFSGISAGVEPYRIDPDHSDVTSRSINAGHAQRAELLLGWMTSVIGDRTDLLPKITPDYPALGKRVLQDDGSWLSTLRRADVELVRTGIRRIRPDGIETVDGTFHPVDIICYATGFRHNDFLATMTVTGRDGVSLREQWGDEPMAHLGITAPNFPNLFCLYGPGTNLAAGASLFYHAEFQTHFAMDAIRQTLTAGASACEVRPEALKEYSERYQNEISQLVWSHSSITHSHYKNPAGKVFTLSPWALDAYWAWTRQLDPDEYRIA
ncbi:flavin-containing monooxygenase [Frankia sp. AgKG'84/4]|uniref:flavin-containing monooxygenase n=1 Tax=Frankia sp. AgKG'84/4 TaxID=573490 RepID=UPI00200F3BBB|nr:NAD(P)/FAD-dependent oxidoreductase [Frankia sp. AgKG'84/4]MCL9794557.1 NAD(P)/FAD-dependent oxidoreductase [Frankia sp. AgKG'84/4]